MGLIQIRPHRVIKKEKEQREVKVGNMSWEGNSKITVQSIIAYSLGI